MVTPEPERRFWLLLVALAVLLLGYPYFGDSRAGVFAGGVASLAVLTTGVYAHRANRGVCLTALVLAIVSAATSIRAFVADVSGDPLVEASFTAFYAFMTVSVFWEFIQTRHVTRDTMYGAVCVYLLIGLSFANLYDLIETLQPESFQINVEIDAPEEKIHWRTLLFFSFMTLTTVGLGDVTPVTVHAQSLVSIQGVIGVLYVAVLVARIVGLYVRRQGPA